MSVRADNESQCERCTNQFPHRAGSGIIIYFAFQFSHISSLHHCTISLHKIKSHQPADNWFLPSLGSNHAVGCSWGVGLCEGVGRWVALFFFVLVLAVCSLMPPHAHMSDLEPFVLMYPFVPEREIYFTLTFAHMHHNPHVMPRSHAPHSHTWCICRQCAVSK